MIEYHLPNCAFVIRRPPQIGPSVNLTNYDLLFPIKIVVMDSLYRITHPIPEAKRTRTRPLEILCLGLSRSGTNSLKQVLEILGYKRSTTASTSLTTLAT